MKCPFCDNRIVQKQKIYETKNEYVLHNIRPRTKGHVIIIPKRHTSNIRELTNNETKSLFDTVKAVSTVLERKLKPAGLNYGFNEGEIAGQTINHLHFHVIPRYKNDNIPEHHLFHRPDKEKKNLSDEELKESVAELRKIFMRQ